MLFCSIRKQTIEKTPEEEVRQALLQRLLAAGYPESLIAVEKSLASLPHLSGHKQLPDRRADILVFSANIHPQYPLFPLLLIECKAQSWNGAVMRQLLGYNLFVQAPLIALANPSEIKTAHRGSEGWIFQPGIPSYEEALKFVEISF